MGFDDAPLGRPLSSWVGSAPVDGRHDCTVDSVRAEAYEDDAPVFFDTKGDYLERFYQPGDVSTGWMGQSTSGARVWNLFRELDPGPQLLEQVTEISATLWTA